MILCFSEEDWSLLDPAQTGFYGEFIIGEDYAVSMPPGKTQLPCSQVSGRGKGSLRMRATTYRLRYCAESDLCSPSYLNRRLCVQDSVSISFHSFLLEWPFLMCPVGLGEMVPALACSVARCLSPYPVYLSWLSFIAPVV